MSYQNRENLKKLIGRTGLFFNNEKDSTEVLVYGTLKEVSENGNCLSEKDIYFDEFVPHEIELKNSNLILGKKVVVNKKYISKLEKDKNGFGYLKVWRIEDISFTEGVFVGYRILKEGDFDWETNSPTRHIKVALIATNLRGCIYCPLSCC